MDPTTHQIITGLLNGLPSAAVIVAACVAGLFWLRSRLEKYLDSYMGEKGKTRARAEDIDKLSDEVRVLTRETELIKITFAQQIEVMKHEHQKELEELRTKSQSTFSRISKVHEKEFEILPTTWFKLHEANGLAFNVAGGRLRYSADVEGMSDILLEEFLESTKFSDFQKKQIRETSNRQQCYTEIRDGLELDEAREQARQFSNYVVQHRIFMSEELKTLFTEFAGELTLGIALFASGRHHRDGKTEEEGRRKILELEKRIPDVEKVVKARLQSEEA